MGNVLATISDRKQPQDIDNDGIIDYFSPMITSTNDYYPFGMLMPGRQCNSPGYHFGFNGKEKDDEWHGSSGTVYDYGFRIYDARIARFLSVDPLFKSYPWYTPYQFAGNKPIWAIDLDGLEEMIITMTREDGSEIELTPPEKKDIIPMEQRTELNKLRNTLSEIKQVGNENIELQKQIIQTIDQTRKDIPKAAAKGAAIGTAAVIDIYLTRGKLTSYAIGAKGIYGFSKDVFGQLYAKDFSLEGVDWWDATVEGGFNMIPLGAINNHLLIFGKNALKTPIDLSVESIKENAIFKTDLEKIGIEYGLRTLSSYGNECFKLNFNITTTFIDKSLRLNAQENMENYVEEKKSNNIEEEN